MLIVSPWTFFLYVFVVSVSPHGTDSMVGHLALWEVDIEILTARASA